MYGPKSLFAKSNFDVSLQIRPLMMIGGLGNLFFHGYARVLEIVIPRILRARASDPN